MNHELHTALTLNNASLANCTFSVTGFQQVKEQMLNWAQQFSNFSFLDNHQYHIQPHTVECMLAVCSVNNLRANAGTAIMQLEQFIEEKKRWLFGHLAYDLKNEIESLSSSHIDEINFPDLFFFEPEIVIHLDEEKIVIEGENAEEIFHAITQSPLLPRNAGADAIQIKNRISKEEYLLIIKELQKHILRGNCYEINFCQEFFAEDVVIDPVAVYKKLSAVSPNPFSALYRLDDKYLICASPERFLKKQGNEILSQPIKGTSKRIPADVKQDMINKNNLLHSPKDRSENVMVVDLVRNDLSKVCIQGTVKVDELYGIYSFPQVHQMISTVSGQLKKGISFSDILHSTFPMGSMTGAPKKKVMELIEQYEKVKRGIFSGALGFISPDGDFDFNVVIRSIMYNAGNRYLSYQTGSAITFYSNAQEEWNECMLKAEAIKKALSN